MVEKPKFEDAPSKQAIIGRYVLTPRVFELLEQTTPGAGGEIQLTDGIKALLKEEKVFGYTFKGKRFDAGESSACYRHSRVRPQAPRVRRKVPRVSEGARRCEAELAELAVLAELAQKRLLANSANSTRSFG